MNRSEIIKLINSNPSAAFSQEINLDSGLTEGRITGVYINTATLNGGVYINRAVPFECDIKGDNLKETGEKIFVTDGHNKSGYKELDEEGEAIFEALCNAGLTDFDSIDVNIYASLNVWQLIEDIESLLEDMNEIRPHLIIKTGAELQAARKILFLEVEEVARFFGEPSKFGAKIEEFLDLRKRLIDETADYIDAIYGKTKTAVEVKWWQAEKEFSKDLFIAATPFDIVRFKLFQSVVSALLAQTAGRISLDENHALDKKSPLIKWLKNN